MSDISQPGFNQSLAPTELVGFEQQRLGLRRGAREGLAQLDFDRGLSNLRRRRSVRDLTRTFDRRREGIDPELAARGLLHSGIRRAQRQDLRQAFRRGRRDIRFEFGVQRDQINRRSRGIERQLRQGLGDVDLLEQALRAENASNVEVQ